MVLEAYMPEMDVGAYMQRTGVEVCKQRAEKFGNLQAKGSEDWKPAREGQNE